MQYTTIRMEVLDMVIKHECKLIGWDIKDLDTDSHEASSLETHPHAMIKVWRSHIYKPSSKVTRHYEPFRDIRYQCEHCKERLLIDNNGIIQGG